MMSSGKRRTAVASLEPSFEGSEDRTGGDPGSLKLISRLVSSQWRSPRGAGVLSNPEYWPAMALRDSELILPLQNENTPSSSSIKV